MKKNFKEKLISGWKVFIKDPILHILFASVFVTISVGILFVITLPVFRFYKLVKDDHVLAYLAVLLGSMLLLYAYVSLKNFYESLINPKPKTRFEQYLEEDQPVTQILWVAHIIGYPLFIYIGRFGLDEKLDGYQWVIVLGILFVSILLVLIVRWLKALIIRRFEAKRESAAKSIKASENRPPQHIEKSPPRKDQNDQVMASKGKKEKSLYQRLRELPLSKDRVGQSFIIVRGGKESHKKTTVEPPNSSENRLPQHLEKSTPRKDQDDQGMVAKGKKEKSLYQRLKEMPYSKDRVGQSIIIVRGRHVIKPKSKSSKPGENKDY